MEFKYTTSFDDFIEAAELGVSKRPKIFCLSILTRVLFLIIIFSYMISLFNTYPGNFFQFIKEPVVIFQHIFLILESIFILFLSNLFLAFLIKKRITKAVKENPYLIEEKTVIFKPQTLQINYMNRQATIQIKKIYEKNKVGDIIPLSLFKSDEEKQLFLDIINIPVKKVKNKGRYFKVI